MLVSSLNTEAIPFLRPPSPDSPFWRARHRLIRADKHIADLKAAVSSWLEADTFAHFTELDPSGEHELHTLSFFIPIPEAVSDCAFDAISNLRASLDSAAYAVVSVYSPSDAEKTHFPIAATESDFKSLINRKYHSAFPREVADILRDLQPYKGGRGHMIWALNRIRRQAEHRQLTRCVARVDFKLITAHIRPGDEFHFFEYVEDRENDIVFAISPVGSQFEFETDITVNVAFGPDVDAAAGRPTVQFLHAIREQVDAAVYALEEGARRCGIIQ